MKDPFGCLYRIYDEDVEAFKKLGLSVAPAQRFGHFEQGYVGKIKFEHGGMADVYVTMAPAHFWEFNIVPTEGGPVTLKTGSGLAKEFLPTVELFANSMIAAELKQ